MAESIPSIHRNRPLSGVEGEF